MPSRSSRKRKKYRVDPAEVALQQARYAELVEKFNLGEFGPYRHVSMSEYFKIIFGRQGQLRLQEKGKDHYKDGHYNAIIRKISKGGKTSHLWWIVTDTMEGIEQYNKVKFAITSPLTYIGKERSLYKRETDEEGKFVKVDHSNIGNARYLFGIALDIDKVYVRNVKYLHRQIKLGHYPEPTLLVTSGNGLHLYFCFEQPILITKKNVELLNMFKFSMTCMMWSYNGTSQQKKIEFHNIGQGYRIPDTQTKFDRVVLGWIRTDEPRYYTLRELNEFIKTWRRMRPDQFDDTKVLSDASIKFLESGSIKKGLTSAELRDLENDIRLPAHWSLKTAREKFGEEWYQYILEHGSKDWNFKDRKQLYYGWLKRLQYGADSGTSVSIGHRYWCIYVLAAWAFNCDIPFAQLQRDAYSLMELFNELVDDEDKHVPFTIRDCNAALQIYKERKENNNSKVIRLSRISTQRVTGLKIEPNKRNYNDLATHGRKRLQKRKENAEEEGRDWKEDITGRKPKDKMVAEWRAAHPEGSKYACAKELCIDKKTVYKWWNCTAEDLAAKKLVFGYQISDKEPSELHDLGAEVNYGYITDKKIAAAAMQNAEGYEAQDTETIRKTGDGLTDAINYGALNVEDLMRSMGVPEFMIPMMKAEMNRLMQTPEFWEHYRKARPEVDMSKWPSEARKAYEAAVSEHKEKK